MMTPANMLETVRLTAAESIMWPIPRSEATNSATTAPISASTTPICRPAKISPAAEGSLALKKT